MSKTPRYGSITKGHALLLFNLLAAASIAYSQSGSFELVLTTPANHVSASAVVTESGNVAAIVSEGFDAPTHLVYQDGSSTSPNIILSSGDTLSDGNTISNFTFTDTIHPVFGNDDVLFRVVEAAKQSQTTIGLAIHTESGIDTVPVLAGIDPILDELTDPFFGTYGGFVDPNDSNRLFIPVIVFDQTEDGQIVTSVVNRNTGEVVDNFLTSTTNDFMTQEEYYANTGHAFYPYGRVQGKVYTSYNGPDPTGNFSRMDIIEPENGSGFPAPTVYTSADRNALLYPQGFSLPEDRIMQQIYESAPFGHGTSLFAGELVNGESTQAAGIIAQPGPPAQSVNAANDCEKYDFNNDGQVDSTDLGAVTACSGQQPTGDCADKDTDGDGDIDAADLIPVTNCFGPVKTANDVGTRNAGVILMESGQTAPGYQAATINNFVAVRSNAHQSGLFATYVSGSEKPNNGPYVVLYWFDDDGLRRIFKSNDDLGNGALEDLDRDLATQGVGNINTVGQCVLSFVNAQDEKFTYLFTPDTQQEGSEAMVVY